jgi:hypothetical protein
MHQIFGMAVPILWYINLSSKACVLAQDSIASAAESFFK